MVKEYKDHVGALKSIIEDMNKFMSEATIDVSDAYDDFDSFMEQE